MTQKSVSRGRDLTLAQHAAVRRQLPFIPAYVWLVYAWILMVRQLPLARPPGRVPAARLRRKSPRPPHFTPKQPHPCGIVPVLCGSHRAGSHLRAVPASCSPAS